MSADVMPNRAAHIAETRRRTDSGQASSIVVRRIAIFGSALAVTSETTSALQQPKESTDVSGIDAHYDVIVVGSGFGGSVAALRAAEKGYSVAVMESGKRWADEDIPNTNWEVGKFVWQPELEMFGIQRVEFLDDVLVLSGAGVGGGSHVYGNTLYVPPKQFFDAREWASITDWADEMAPYIDQARRMLGVVRALPANRRRPAHAQSRHRHGHGANVQPGTGRGLLRPTRCRG